jgi:hypothetical protein
MSLRRSRTAVAAVMSSSLLAGLAVAESSRATSPDTTLPGSGDGPVGVIAIGHSGLTGENSDPDRPFQRALENSWATGTNPEVNSVYLRLIAAHPETEGHVANTAQGGATADTLAYQASMAMGIVPTPELVIIQTIDNDMVCPLDEGVLTDFGDNVTRALDAIVEASPESQILMVGQRGPAVPANDFPFLEELIAAHPEVKASLTGDGSFPCGGFYAPSGESLQENVDYLHDTIDAYHAEQQRRCDAVPQCRTDEGANNAYVEELENLSSDFNHLNVRGQAAEAELIWPVVAEMLGLDEATASSAVSSTELES